MHTSLRPAFLFSALLGAAAVSPAQTTYIVDPSGGGNFRDLPPARVSGENIENTRSSRVQESLKRPARA